jgi:hypothetical protein
MRTARIAGLLLMAALAWAPPAAATFHEMWIREIYPGSQAQENSEYVELQMWSSGQHRVEGHSISFYGPSGSSLGSETFTAKVASGANQSTVLAATTEAAGEFGVGPDLTIAAGKLDPAGGAVCWAALDCVSWGGFSGASLPSAPGPPATPGGIPDGMALRRTIAPGCPSLLEATDDRNSGTLDFEAVFPAPRPNAVPPSERPCSSSGGGSGYPSEAGGRGAPQTKLRRKPPKRTTDRTPTFRFSSDEPGSSFQCKLDRKLFRLCRSPFTTKRLGLGPHAFRVRARDGSGLLDQSPAIYRFAVIEKP